MHAHGLVNFARANLSLSVPPLTAPLDPPDSFHLLKPTEAEENAVNGRPLLSQHPGSVPTRRDSETQPSPIYFDPMRPPLFAAGLLFLGQVVPVDERLTVG